MFSAQLETCIEGILVEKPGLHQDRIERLKAIRQYVEDQVSRSRAANLTFICTHNSRRSHLGQIWAQVMAWHFGWEQVYTFSGGTEATAFHPHAITAIKRSGLKVDVLQKGDNPMYSLQTGNGAISPVFSKTYDHPANPQKDFCAIMTCSEADEACPFIPGASLRVSLPYVDPKKSDGSGKEAEVYEMRSRQIATEMAWVFRK